MSEKSLIDEIKENARNDRNRLEKHCDNLLKFATNPEVMSEEAASAAVMEQLSAATDSLTKINQQLVELLKIESKKDLLKGTKGHVDASRESLYQEIDGDSNPDFDS